LIFQLKDRGRLLNTDKLGRYAESRKLKITHKALDKLRSSVHPTAIRRNSCVRPKQFSGVQRPCLGDVHMDFCNLWPEWRKWNEGFVGAVVTVNTVGFMACVGLRGHSVKDYEACVETLVADLGFTCLEKLISDREMAVYSQKF
jgi:hypothetical protein